MKTIIIIWNRLIMIFENLNILLIIISLFIGASIGSAIFYYFHNNKKHQKKIKANLDFTFEWKSNQNLELYYLKDPDGQITENSRFANMIGKQVYEQHIIDPEDQIHWLKHVKNLSDRKPFNNIIYHLKDVNGKERTCLVSGNPVFDKKKNFAGYEGIALEITPLRELKREIEKQDNSFRNIIDELPISILITSQDGYVVNANGSACEMLRRPKENILTCDITQIVPGLEKEISNIIEDEGSTIVLKKTVFTEEGVGFSADLTLISFKNQDQKLCLVSILNSKTMQNKNISEQEIIGLRNELNQTRQIYRKLCNATLLMSCDFNKNCSSSIKTGTLLENAQLALKALDIKELKPDSLLRTSISYWMNKQKDNFIDIFNIKDDNIKIIINEEISNDIRIHNEYTENILKTLYRRISNYGTKPTTFEIQDFNLENNVLHLEIRTDKTKNNKPVIDFGRIKEITDSSIDLELTLCQEILKKIGGYIAIEFGDGHIQCVRLKIPALPGLPTSIETATFMEDIDQIPLIDRAQIQMLSKNMTEEAWDRIIQRFIEQAQLLIDHIQISKTPEELKDHAHSLKGMASSVGAHRLSQLAKMIGYELKEKDLEDAKKYLPELNKMTTKAIKQKENEYKNIIKLKP